MEPIKKQFVASTVSFSETQQSEIYQSITLRMFEAPGANLNGCAVTEAFIDEIVANADKYVCIPLCADVERIKRGDLGNLGHMYDARTGEFKSQIIGAFHSFSKEITDDGCALIGEARVMKRNKEVCEALAELFDKGELNFSFEVTAGDYTEDEFGTIIIDVSEKNFLEGMAVVTNPAYENAKALQLVAEVEEGKGSNMEQEQVVAEVIDVSDIIAPAVVEDNAPSAVVETETAEPAVDVASCPEENEQDRVEEAAVDQEEKPEDEEEETAACKKKCEEEDEEEEEVCEKAELAEDIMAQLKADIESLRTEIAALKAELAEKKEVAEVEEVEVIASAEPTVNPFVSEISTKKGYQLLESCQFSGTHYSLLDPAD